LTGTGLALGLGGAIAAGHTLAHLLYGVSPYDPSTFIIVTLSVGICALLASYVPARRAGTVDPMEHLRHE
jgi:ABC-type antimicrobial peptide transport system permease subunit